MEFRKEDVLKIDCMSITDFCKVYGDGVSSQAVNYNMAKGNIDFVKIGTENLVVLTDKSKAYRPNASPVRTKN